MKRVTQFSSIAMALSCLALGYARGADNQFVHDESVIVSEQIVVQDNCGSCADPWTKFHGFLFRRYAGSVEMESKTPYPMGYSGRFTYLPWAPDWVKTPANRVRESRYRHHDRSHAISARPQIEGSVVEHHQVVVDQQAIDSTSNFTPNDSVFVPQPPVLEEVEVESLR